MQQAGTPAGVPGADVVIPAINSIERIHFTILYPSWFSNRSRSGAPNAVGRGFPFMAYASSV